MMTPQTVQQLLQVFRKFRDNHASGVPLHRSYQEAVRTVADAHSITYQTVGDGCRRRLGLNDINELYELLATWVKGDSRGLVRQLKDNAEPSSHAEIDRFFSDGGTAPTAGRKALPKVSPHDESEPFTFRISARDARMLKALAELEGISAPELTARIVSVEVHDRMTVVARGIIKNADAHV